MGRHERCGLSCLNQQLQIDHSSCRLWRPPGFSCGSSSGSSSLHSLHAPAMIFSFTVMLMILYLSSKTIIVNPHSTLTTCLMYIKTWMQRNFLKLNCNKSGILMIGPDSLTHSTHDFALNIDGSTVIPSTQIHNLGVIFDPTLFLFYRSCPMSTTSPLPPLLHCPPPTFTVINCCRNTHSCICNIQA